MSMGGDKVQGAKSIGVSTGGARWSKHVCVQAKSDACSKKATLGLASFILKEGISVNGRGVL